MEPDQTRLVWITMLAIADKNGEVQGSIPGLARIAGVSVEATREAINKFLSPDPDSRTKDDEGRRIETIDGGWRLLNYRKYREMASREEAREAEAKRKADYRARLERNAAMSRTVPDKSSLVPRKLHIAEAEAEAEGKINKHLLSATADQSEIESIFQAYPSQRRGGRKEAYKAIHAASKTTTLQALLSAVIAYANSAEVREKIAKGEQHFIPLLPTWLNKGRYETVEAQQPYDEFAYHPDYKPPQIGPHTVMVPLTDQDI